MEQYGHVVLPTMLVCVIALAARYAFQISIGFFISGVIVLGIIMYIICKRVKISVFTDK